MSCLAVFMHHMNTWVKIPRSRQQLIICITQAKVRTQLQASGKTFVAEDIARYEDGEDEVSLAEHLKKQLDNTETQLAVRIAYSRLASRGDREDDIESTKAMNEEEVEVAVDRSFMVDSAIV